MTNYLIRRIFQMGLVILLAAVFVYFLFNISPGGPLAGIQQQQRRITREDLARLRANYELDLYWPIRFTRWLIGFPTGPIVIGGHRIRDFRNYGPELSVTDVIVKSSNVGTVKIAQGLGKPGAARAVGNAVGANPVAWLIPCHRVIRESGIIGGYRWQRGRKMALLAKELAPAQAAE